MQASMKPSSARGAASRVSVVFLALSASLLVQCRKQQEPEGGSFSGSAGAPVVPSPATASPSASSAVASGSGSGMLNSKPEVEAAPPPEPNQVAIMGDWIEASLYRFKATTIQRCAKLPATSGKAASDAGSIRLGITVAIASKVDPFLSSPHDLTLDHDGVLLEAELKANPPCGSALPTKQLHAGETAQGVVVFTLPDLAFSKGLKLHFKPTRWGGAPPVSVNIPECLDACPAKKPGRAADH